MPERPIIFSGEMVRAILDGRKTQTRRAMKDKPFCPNAVMRRVDDKWLVVPQYANSHDGCPPVNSVYRTCPYGTPGDLLWVRETWKVQPTPGCTWGDSMMGRKLSVFYKDGTRRDFLGESINGPGIHIDVAALDYDPMKYGVWRPSIHMRKEYARIWLEVSDVRVERVQDVAEEDAVAEGFEYREHFIRLWDLLNDKRGYGFAANPWVWVVGFKVADHA